MTKINYIVTIIFSLLLINPLFSKKNPDLKPKRNESSNRTINELYKRGVKLYMRANYDAALTHFQGVIALDPNNFKALNYLGGAKYHLGDYNGAITQYNKAIKLKPNAYYILHNRGYAFHTLSQQGKAIEDYSKSLNIRRDYLKSLYFRGLAYYETGKNDKSINDFLLIVITKPHNYKAWYMMGLAKFKKGDKRGALNCIKQARIISNKTLPDYSKNINPFSIKKKYNSKDKAF